MEVSNLSKLDTWLVWLITLLVILVAASGCSSSSGKKSSKQGMLERVGIHDASDLEAVVIRCKGSYLITDKPTLERVYDLLNNAGPATGSKLMKHSMVTLVQKNGRTMSYSFDLYNSDLSWEHGSRAFVEFVKNDVIGKKKYTDTSHLPSFSTKKAVKVEGLSAQRPLSVANVGRSIQPIASLYKPWTHYPTLSSWQTIASSCSAEYPGVEVTFDKPITFKTLMGKVEREPPHGSDALRVTTLVVDKMLVYLDRDKSLWLAFHSTANGAGWFVVGAYDSKYFGGKAPESVYRGLLSK